MPVNSNVNLHILYGIRSNYIVVIFDILENSFVRKRLRVLREGPLNDGFNLERRK
jgi:hypothetical protein